MQASDTYVQAAIQDVIETVTMNERLRAVVDHVGSAVEGLNGIAAAARNDRELLDALGEATEGLGKAADASQKLLTRIHERIEQKYGKGAPFTIGAPSVQENIVTP